MSSRPTGTDIRTTPPFRADHVGSLLRPPALLDAGQFCEVEDAAIVDIVAMQADAGPHSATDGEFRRTAWHMDFIYQLGGVGKAPGNMAVKFRNAEGALEWTPAALLGDADRNDWGTLDRRF